MTRTKPSILPYLEINLAVLFISTSGALGRYIELPPEVTILFRSLLATLLMLVYCKLRGFRLTISDKSDLRKILLCGVFFGIHWVTYFYALRLSSVAVGMLSIYTYPVITSFLEPLILKVPFKKSHLILGMLVLAGIWFLVPDFSFENTYFIAVLFGITSALFYALRNILMKPQVARHNGSVLMLYQIATISAMLSPFLFTADFTEVWDQVVPIATLALLTTCVGHTLLLLSFRHFSVTTASIMSSVQPVYGIIIGMIFLDEIPALTTVIGGILILLAVVIESFRNVRAERR